MVLSGTALPPLQVLQLREVPTKGAPSVACNVSGHLLSALCDRAAGRARRPSLPSSPRLFLAQLLWRARARVCGRVHRCSESGLPQHPQPCRGGAWLRGKHCSRIGSACSVTEAAQCQFASLPSRLFHVPAACGPSQQLAENHQAVLAEQRRAASLSAETLKCRPLLLVPWPSGLRRVLQAHVRKGASSNLAGATIEKYLIPIFSHALLQSWGSSRVLKSADSSGLRSMKCGLAGLGQLS